MLWITRAFQQRFEGSRGYRLQQRPKVFVHGYPSQVEWQVAQVEVSVLFPGRTRRFAFPLSFILKALRVVETFSSVHYDVMLSGRINRAVFFYHVFHQPFAEVLRQI